MHGPIEPKLTCGANYAVTQNDEIVFVIGIEPSIGSGKDFNTEPAGRFKD